MTDQFVARLPERTVAMIRAFSPMLERALLIGGVLAVVVAILVTPLIADKVPSPFGPVVSAIAAAAVGLGAAYLSFPRRSRRAFESFSWLGRAEVDRFAQRTGGPVPSNEADIERWLASTPSTSATRFPRAEILAFVGRYDDARAEMAAANVDTPEDAMELASLRQYVGWLEDGAVDTGELTAAAATLPAGSRGRGMGLVNVALADARDRFIRRDPTWFEPLERVRAALGRSPSLVVLRDTWIKLGTLFLIVALVTALIVLLLR